MSGIARRSLLGGLRRRASTQQLLRLDDALAALGRDVDMGTRGDEVPVKHIVGSVARPDDFDADFTPASRESRERIDRIISGINAGTFPDALDLVQVGELYFVRDGHHRVAAARALGWVTVPAVVTASAPSRSPWAACVPNIC